MSAWNWRILEVQSYLMIIVEATFTWVEGPYGGETVTVMCFSLTDIQ